MKRWPFMSSPAEVAAMMDDALRYFGGDMLAAVRNVFIEQGVALAQGDPIPPHPLSNLTCVSCGAAGPMWQPAHATQLREDAARYRYAREGEGSIKIVATGGMRNPQLWAKLEGSQADEAIDARRDTT